MRRTIAAFAAVAVGWTVAVACGSVPDVTFGTGDGGPNPPVDGPSGDAPQDSIVPGCTPNGAEVCDDGVDNDCNGHTDCDDPACTPTFACVDIPAGWTYVPFAESMRPSCPLGDTPADFKVVNGDGSFACTCTCSGTAGPATCAAGSFTVASSGESTCSSSPSTASVGANAAVCTLMGTTLSVGADIKITPPTGPTACGPTVNTAPAPADGRACTPPRFGKGCSGTQVCAPKPAAPLAECVQKSGVNACPVGFTKGHLVGTSVTNDNRACTGCACAGPTACTGGSVSVYDNVMCKTNGMNKAAETISSTCAASSPNSGFTASYFTSTPPTGGCATTPTTPASFGGAITFAGEATICCM